MEKEKPKFDEHSVRKQINDYYRFNPAILFAAIMSIITFTLMPKWHGSVALTLLLPLAYFLAAQLVILFLRKKQ